VEESTENKDRFVLTRGGKVVLSWESKRRNVERRAILKTYLTCKGEKGKVLFQFLETEKKRDFTLEDLRRGSSIGKKKKAIRQEQTNSWKIWNKLEGGVQRRIVKKRGPVGRKKKRDATRGRKSLVGAKRDLHGGGNWRCEGGLSVKENSLTNGQKRFCVGKVMGGGKERKRGRVLRKSRRKRKAFFLKKKSKFYT